MRIESTGLAVLLNCFVLLIVSTQRHRQGEMRLGIVRVQLQGLAPLFNGVGHLIFLHQFECIVRQTVNPGRLRVDLFQAIRRNIHKLGNVDGTIGCGRVVNDNRRSVIAIGVNMGQHEPGIGSARL